MKRFFLLILMVLLSACTAKTGIEVRDVRSRPAMQGGNGGVFFDLLNHDAVSDELIGASSAVAETVEVHETKMEGDVMKMQMIPSVTIEAKSKVTFKPGGLHVMLIGLKQELKTGDEFDVTLHFKNHADITVRVKVKDAMPGMGM